MPQMVAIPEPDILYPESDGEPMSDNTLQFDWIVYIATNLRTMYQDRDDVFVSGNQNWYPVQGEPRIVAAPDVYVVFGRPQGYRGSWKQWEENDIPMTVVFEVLSMGNTFPEMIEKLHFYDEHGVQEYYLIDPYRDRMDAYIRGNATLVPKPTRAGFVSPKLGIRFAQNDHDELILMYPDGKPFLTFEEQAKIAQAAEASKALIEQRANRLSELTRKLLAQQATPEEIAELQRLTNPL